MIEFTPKVVYEHGRNLRDGAAETFHELGYQAVRFDFMPASDSMTVWRVNQQSRRYSSDIHPVRSRILPVFNALLRVAGTPSSQVEDAVFATRTDLYQSEQTRLLANKPRYANGLPDLSLRQGSGEQTQNLLGTPLGRGYLGEFMALDMSNLVIESSRRSPESGAADFRRMAEGLRELSEAHGQQPYDYTKYGFQLEGERFATIWSSSGHYDGTGDEPYIALNIYSSFEALQSSTATATLHGGQAPGGEPSVSTFDWPAMRSDSAKDMLTTPVSLNEDQTNGLLGVYDQLTSQPANAVVCDRLGSTFDIAAIEQSEAALQMLPPAGTMIARVGLTYL